MLIQNTDELQRFYSKYRLWQGIPGIEVSPKGRIFSTFYTGGTKEELGNFVVLMVSDDDGNSFSEPVAVAFKEGGRCYDPVLWIDPLGRLWFTWAFASPFEKSGVFGVVCEDPDADELVWSDEFFVGSYVMMNKPTVLSTGEWLFPVAAWDPMIKMPALPPEDYGHEKEETGAFVYALTDHQTSFQKLGGVRAPNRSFDEHMVIELKNGRLMMLIRTTYGIAVSYSYDGGRTWTEAVDSKIGGPCSRFCIRRLSSGRILLVNHYKFRGRSHLTALLSEDEAKTWKYSLLLDERGGVSYPDAVETKDGYIYITYDHDRGAYKNKLEEVLAADREILFAKITEEDIIAGKTVDPGSRLKNIISKLGDYCGEDNPYHEVARYSDAELAEKLCQEYSGRSECCSSIFDYYPIACENMSEIDAKHLDDLFSRLEDGTDDAFSILLEAVKLVRAVSIKDKETIPVVDMVENFIVERIHENPSISEIANKLHVSEFYLMHIFKKQTGITIGEYKTALQIAKAKVLLRENQKSISEISCLCGFESLPYFSRVFRKNSGCSPTEYRALNSF